VLSHHHIVRRVLPPAALAVGLLVVAARPAGAAPTVGSGPAHHDATTVNGEVPPGAVTTATVTLLLEQRLGKGRIMYQFRGERPPGTRAPIHTHPFGGATCVLQGESVLRIEGVPGSRTNGVGQCFFMPAGPAMVNFSSGTEPLVTLETFVVPKRVDIWKVVEPDALAVSGQFGP